ncbi:MAG: hypothetical protein CMM48_12915 [Rhodospirillaceae bacterium]|nr:hypothetical protein [Rhodospirillaceae bacterium]
MVRRIAITVLMALFLSVGFGSEAQAQKFCWKDSYGRGVGTIPKACKHDENRIGLLCYKKCRKGTKRFGFDCHSVCPRGFSNQGLFCRHAEYGRGAGYPWKFGDALNDHGMRHRCEHDHGKGNCEKNGLIYYPKCKRGYHSFGCCICRPHVPNCHRYGLNKGIDLSCAKKIYIGHPKTGQCSRGHEKDAGLCYKNCKRGFDGVGPVCWGDKPRGWVNCGMGAAKNSKTCAKIVFSQVASVGKLAMNIATAGSSGEAEEAAEGAEDAEELSKLRKKYEEMKKAWDEIKEAKHVKKALDAAKKAKKVGGATWKAFQAGKQAKHAVTKEDMARVAAMIASIVDPTGVAGTVAAYTYPKCSKYFK